MTPRAFIPLLLAGIFLVSAAPQSRPHKGTWNADLTCGGYPQDECGETPALVGAFRARPAQTFCTSVRRQTWTPSEAAPAIFRAVPPYRSIPFGDGGSVTRIALDRQPYWAISGIWSTEGGSLLLVDALRMAILRYSSQGRALGVWPPHTQGLYPTEIRANGTGYLLKVSNMDFWQIDGKGFGLRHFNTFPEGQIFNWVPLGDSLLVFADALESGERWVSGWFRIPLAAPTHFELLKAVEPSSPERSLYPLGNPYVAAVGSRGYFLAFHNGKTSLLAVEPGNPKSKLSELPLAMNLPTPFLPKEILDRYRVLEQLTAPAGLYGQGGRLYLLTRHPGEHGTEWQLHRLDPATGADLGHLVLPTATPHLLLVPGKRQWALLEKGSVLRRGMQKAESLLLIPASSIESIGEKGKGQHLLSPMNAPHESSPAGEPPHVPGAVGLKALRLASRFD
jgi:hypothetical protein